MLQKGSEAPDMAKTKENKRPMEENKILKLNMTPIFIILIKRITSLPEHTMEMQNYKLSTS